ncbi:MAG TPA: Ig-like domain-containing protein, partial [Gaiellaceae bacterium]|nr:Ig-like domain-containing protein [Gaiellaceae bacterium]
MASSKHLRRQHARSTRSGTGRFRTLGAVRKLPLLARLAAFAGLAAVLALTTVLVRGNDSSPTPRFLTAALGAPQPDAPLVRRPAAALKVAVDRRGFTARVRSGALRIAADVPSSGKWKRFGHGVSRPTPFGSEAVVYRTGAVESLLTVDRKLGRHTWSWRLSSMNLEPRSMVDGSVEFRRAGDFVGVRILPVAIYDRAGKDVTPAGSHWTLARDRRGWSLRLRLDDATLPTPYVIDPVAIVGGSACGLVNSAASATSAGCAVATNANKATSFSISAPTGIAVGDLLLMQVNIRSNDALSASTITGGGGAWTQLGSTSTIVTGAAGTGFESGTFYRVVTAADVGASWSIAIPSKPDASAAIAAYTSVGATPIDGTNVATGASGTTASVSGGFSTSAGGDQIVAFMAAGCGSNCLSAGTGTGEASISSTTGGPTSRATSLVEDQAQATAGAVGTYSATISGSYPWAARVIAVAPKLVADATNSSVAASATSIPADNTTTSTVTVTLKDASGNLIPGHTVQLLQGSGTATISPATATTNASGVATFTVKSSTAQQIAVQAKDTGDGVTVTQSPTIWIGLFQTTNPTIAGTATVGSTLTYTGGTYTPAPATTTHQWQRCDASGANCVSIAGATGTTYTLVGADAGSTIRVADTIAATGYTTATATSAATAAVANGTIATSGQVAIAGTARVGQALTATPGTYNPSPTGRSYQWQSCNPTCANIAGATGTTYTPVVGDVGKTIQVIETVTLAGYDNATSTSAQTAAVTPANLSNTTPVGISGTAKVGQTLTRTQGVYSPAPTGYGYQWQRCDATGASCSS